MPWADVLYACDGAFWRLQDGLPQFTGLRLTADTSAVVRYPQTLHKVEVRRMVDRILLDPPGTVGDGGNSGFQALNLAVQFGASRIVLVGYDMRLDRGLHWHGPHPKGMNNPSEAHLPRWRRALNGAAQDLLDMGVEVLNASPASTLTAFPKVTLEELLT